MQLSQITGVAAKLREAKRRALEADDHADLEQQIKDLSERLERTLRSLRTCRRERDRLRRKIKRLGNTEPNTKKGDIMTDSNSTAVAPSDKERAARNTVARFKDATDRLRTALEDAHAAYEDLMVVVAAECANLEVEYGFTLEDARPQRKEGTDNE